MSEQVLNSVRKSNNSRIAINDIEKLKAMIDGAGVTMLTSIDQDGNLRSRPMTLQELDNEGCCWYFADGKSSAVAEMLDIVRVNISMMHSDSYVSISGRACILKDERKAEKLWKPAYKAWFPNGLEDPDLVLVRVSIDHAEYWDAPGGVVTTLIGFVKSLATGKRAETGEHRHLDELKPKVLSEDSGACSGLFNWGLASLS